MGDTAGTAVWAQNSTSVLNSVFSRISLKNRHFNMFTETSNWQDDFPCKNSQTKGSTTTIFDIFHRYKFIVISRSQYISYNGVINL